MKRFQTGASHSGFHFANLFQNCPRKFWFSFVEHLEPRYKSPALTHGSAFHEGKADWYRGKSKTESLRTFADYMEENRENYEDEERYLKDLERGQIMLGSWIEEHGAWDLENFHILNVEHEERWHFADSPHYLTVRRDVDLEWKSRPGQVIIGETKTTGFSARVTEDAVRYGDQATAYIWSARKAYPNKEIIGVQPDISFWSTNTKNPDLIKNVRPDIVDRSTMDLIEFETEMKQLMNEITSKVEAIREKRFPDIQLFPRNTSWCTAFSHPCEYASICRSYRAGRPAPPTFRKRKPEVDSSLGDFV